MIIILCPNMQDAMDAFDIFVSSLCEWHIKRCFESSLCVETTDDIKYLFIDERFDFVFDRFKEDIITVDEFLEDVESWKGVYV